MTIGNSLARFVFNCDGVSTVFPVPIQAYQATDFEVILTAPISAGGAETVLVLNSAYTLAATGSLAPPQWTMTTTIAYAAGYQLQIFCSPIQTQQTQYVQGQSFPSLAVQTNVDRLTQMVQRLQDLMNRSIRAPDGDISPLMLLPPAIQRANTAQGFDSNGNAELLQTLPSGTLSQGSIGQFLYPQTQAEQNAFVTPVALWYPTLNLRRYGADPTGVNASDQALAQAIAVCGTTGGTIRAPGGAYTFANAVILQGSQSIIIQGEGSPTAGGAPATKFTYTGTAAAWFNCNSAVGLQFHGIQLTHSNAGFTGTYATFNHGGPNNDSTFCGFFDCVLGSTLSPTVHLNLDKCTLFTAERCNFLNGNPSVKGQSNAGGSYSNEICFRDCLWLGSAVAPIQDGGQAWVIDSCTFEGVTAGSAVNAFILSSNSNGSFIGLKITGCWFGDCDSTAGTLISLLGSQGVEISGNYISGGANTTAIAMGQTCQGWSIVGNLFIGHLNGINFASTVCANISVKGNVASSVTNPWVNPANCVLGTLDFGPNFGFGVPAGHAALTTPGFRCNVDGTIEQWGHVSVTAGTPVAVTFSKTFPNAVFEVWLSMSAASTTGLECYDTSLLVSGFTANVAGAVGSATVRWRVIGN